MESTITTRRRVLRRFGDWMGVRGLLGATHEDIEAWLDGRRASPGSRAGYLSHLKVFYSWAIIAGHIERDPTMPIPRPRTRPGLPRPINDTDLGLALQMASGPIRVIFCCGAYQGMRCIEISRLTREDILEDRDPPVLLARGKGDKPRVIPLHPETWKALCFLPLPRSGPILRDQYGQPLPAWKISHMGNDFLHGIGIDATMHRLRHWFGTGLYRTSGHNLLLVRDLMGHANVDTTKIYAAYDQAGAAPAVSALQVRPSVVTDPFERKPTLPAADPSRSRGSGCSITPGPRLHEGGSGASDVGIDRAVPPTVDGSIGPGPPTMGPVAAALRGAASPGVDAPEAGDPTEGPG